MRFTIRDVLWFTVVVALGVAWWVDRQAAKARDQLWRNGVVKMITELDETTGFKVAFTTPDGDLIGNPPPVKIFDTYNARQKKPPR